MREALGIFGAIAGVIVVALVGRYGVASSDTPLDGVIAAFFFGVIAIGGIGGPAVAVHLFRAADGWAKLWGLVAGAIAAVALVANLSNSLGAIAGRADRTLAERAQATDARKDHRAELARITREREAMTLAPATADAVQAARDTVASAEAIRQRECGNGDPRQRGPNCRQRETEEQGKRDALAAVVIAKAATDKSTKLDADAAAIRARLAKAAPVASVNPLADTLGRIFAMPAETAATAQQVVMVIVVELLIAFALIAWELLTPRRELEAAPEPAEVAAAVLVPEVAPAAPALPGPRRPRRNAVALIETGRAPGDVAKFAVAMLRPAEGSSLAILSLYDPYCEWCEAHGFRPVVRERFIELFAALCDLSGFARAMRGGKALCLDLELAA